MLHDVVNEPKLDVNPCPQRKMPLSLNRQAAHRMEKKEL